MSQKLAEWLSNVPGFQSVDLEQMKAFAKEWLSLTYTDDYICTEGDPADRIYVLVEGECDVLRTAPNARRYHVATLTPGCLFGHIGIVAMARRTASVRARGTVRVLELSTRRARALVRKDDSPLASGLRRAVIVALSRQLQSATSTTLQLARDAGVTEALPTPSPAKNGHAPRDDDSSDR